MPTNPQKINDKPLENQEFPSSTFERRTAGGRAQNECWPGESKLPARELSPKTHPAPRDGEQGTTRCSLTHGWRERNPRASAQRKPTRALQPTRPHCPTRCPPRDPNRIYSSRPWRLGARGQAWAELGPPEVPVLGA